MPRAASVGCREPTSIGCHEPTPSPRRPCRRRPGDPRKALSAGSGADSHNCGKVVDCSVGTAQSLLKRRGSLCRTHAAPMAPTGASASNRTRCAQLRAPGISVIPGITEHHPQFPQRLTPLRERLIKRWLDNIDSRLGSVGRRNESRRAVERRSVENGAAGGLSARLHVNGLEAKPRRDGSNGAPRSSRRRLDAHEENDPAPAGTVRIAWGSHSAPRGRENREVPGQS